MILFTVRLKRIIYERTCIIIYIDNESRVNTKRVCVCLIVCVL